jgi:enoyl-CoA hydratase/carnithine racemase
MNTLLFEKRGQQAWITLNRPDKHNRLNGEMFVELADAWQEVREDDNVRVVVI